MVDVGEVDARIGRHAVGGDLPQQNAEGPHVRLRKQKRHATTEQRHRPRSRSTAFQAEPLIQQSWPWRRYARDKSAPSWQNKKKRRTSVAKQSVAAGGGGGGHLGGELVVGQALGRRPLDGELGAGVGRVGVVAHEPRQAKVGHLDQVVLADQAVARGQVAVDEVAALQVGHGGGHLGGHVEQDDGVDLVAVGAPQVVEQVAARHELGDDVEGRLAGADAQQLHQVRVLHLLHDGRLFEKVLEGHRVLLERLDGHRHVVALPHRLVDVAVLAAAQFLLHGDVGPLDLPLVRLGRQRKHLRPSTIDYVRLGSVQLGSVRSPKIRFG